MPNSETGKKEPGRPLCAEVSPKECSRDGMLAIRPTVKRVVRGHIHQGTTYKGRLGRHIQGCISGYTSGWCICMVSSGCTSGCVYAGIPRVYLRVVYILGIPRVYLRVVYIPGLYLRVYLRVCIPGLYLRCTLGCVPRVYLSYRRVCTKGVPRSYLRVCNLCAEWSLSPYV